MRSKIDLIEAPIDDLIKRIDKMEVKIKERNCRIGVYEERLNILEEKLNGILIFKKPSCSPEIQLQNVSKQKNMIIANVSENENDLFLKDLKLKLNIKSIKRLSSSKPEKNGMSHKYFGLTSTSSQIGLISLKNHHSWLFSIIFL